MKTPAPDPARPHGTQASASPQYTRTGQEKTPLEQKTVYKLSSQAGSS